MEWSCEPEILEFLEHGRPIPTLLKILRKQLAYLETQPLAPPHFYLEVIDQRYARWRFHNGAKAIRAGPKTHDSRAEKHHSPTERAISPTLSPSQVNSSGRGEFYRQGQTKAI